MQQVKLEQFEGPLELLLDLIEREKLDITLVSLSQVTEQYLLHLEELSGVNPDELADFLVVASKLLLIKSRVLLPDLLPEDEDGDDLALQLKMYKEYYEAAKVIHAMILKKRFSYSRGKPAVNVMTVFNPPKQMKRDDLHQMFLMVLKAIEPIIELPREVVRRTISLQDKISNIRKEILEKATMKFSSLLSKADSKMEIIVTFLALLELVKQRTVLVKQDDMFADIVVESINEQQS